MHDLSRFRSKLLTTVALLGCSQAAVAVPLVPNSTAIATSEAIFDGTFATLSGNYPSLTATGGDGAVLPYFQSQGNGAAKTGFTGTAQVGIGLAGGSASNNFTESIVFNQSEQDAVFSLYATSIVNSPPYTTEGPLTLTLEALNAANQVIDTSTPYALSSSVPSAFYGFQGDTAGIKTIDFIVQSPGGTTTSLYIGQIGANPLAAAAAPEIDVDGVLVPLFLLLGSLSVLTSSRSSRPHLQ